MEDFLTLKNQLCFTIYQTSSEFTKLYSNALQSYGLTYPQYLVLLALWENNGITVKELGQTLNLGTGTLTPMISRMEESGWLRKKRSTEDERKVYIHLQNKAYEERQAITQQVSTLILMCGIEQEEYEQLMLQLSQLQHKLKVRRLQVI